MNRFRLIGPMASHVISEACKVVTMEELDEVECLDVEEHLWWQKYFHTILLY